MSAFLCSHKHIASMVADMVTFGLVSPYLYVATGQSLIRANLKSLRAAYGKNHGFHNEKSDEAYVATFAAMEPYKNRRTTYYETVKLCDCFDYQSCEFDGYYHTNVAKLVDDLRTTESRHAVISSEEYERAPWEI